MKKLIGITGVIGSGKSTVAQIIQDMGYSVLSSDEIAKELINSNKQLQEDLIRKFGEKTFVDGKYNSNYIASVVFGNDENAKSKLTELNNTIHPFVIDELAKTSENLFEQGKDLVFNESALIFEAGLDDAYDYIINVFSPVDNITERLSKKTKLTKDEIIKRMKNQLSAEEKKRLSDFTIDNTGTLESLEKGTKFIVELIKDLPAKDYNKLEMD